MALMPKQHPIVEVRHWLELRQAEGLIFKGVSQRSGIPVHVRAYRAALDPA